MIAPTPAATSMPLWRSRLRDARFLRHLNMCHFRCGSRNFLCDWIWRRRTHRSLTYRSFGKNSGRSRRGNFRSNGGTETRGAFLRLGLPIGATEALGRGHIPLAGILGVAIGFEIARQLKGHHGVACF